MLTKTEVSVYMIVYNGGSYLSGAVESILGQSFTDFEFVIVDDGSTDETPEILASFNDNRVRIFRQPRAGRPRARNRALRECRGNFIAIIDADDLACRDRLARQVDFLNRHPDVGVLATDYEVIDETGRRLWTVQLPTTDRELRRALVSGNPILNSSAMFRREVVEVAGAYDEQLPYCQDHDLWIRAAVKFKVASAPEVLASKRLHGKMIMMTVNRENLRCAIRARSRAVRLFNLPWYYRATFLHLWGISLLPQVVVSVLLRLRWRLNQQCFARLHA